MATPIYTAVFAYDHSVLDGTKQPILGSQVDAMPLLLAQILDGTTAGEMNTAATPLMKINNPVVQSTTAWAASTVVSALQVRHDPASGTANDTMGVEIRLQGDNDAGTPETIDYASLVGKFLDTSDSTEDGGMTIRLIAAGTEVDSVDFIDGTMSFRGAATIDTSGNNALTLNAGTEDVVITASNIEPSSNDGSALGTSGTAWADLFLASGAVIDFAAANMTMTHGTGYVNLSSGLWFINETANTNMTTGLTIQLGPADNQGFCLKSSDVDTGGWSGQAETDDFLTAGKAEAAAGGCVLRAFADDNSTTKQSFVIQGLLEADADTTHTASGTGLVQTAGLQLNGSGSPAAVVANGNIFVASAWTGAAVEAQFIVDVEGDLFANGGTSSTNMVTQYDDYEDAMLVRAFSKVTGRKDTLRESRWDEFVQYNEDDLVKLGILGAPLKDKPLYCVTKLQQLHNGAIWQLYTRMRDAEERLALAENKLLSLEA